MKRLINALTGGGGGPRRAVAGEVVVAEADQTEQVEGNDYFPPDTVNWEYFEPSDRTTVCPWKGVASYYDLVIDGERIPNAAWTYETPSEAAANITEHVAFARGVKVIAAD